MDRAAVPGAVSLFPAALGSATDFGGGCSQQSDALEVKVGEHGRDLSTKKLEVVASITVCSAEAPQRWAPSVWQRCEKRAMLKVCLPSTQLGDLLFTGEQKKCNAL
ncbi:hypothetical protein Anapl_01563 [Anas platyrhynchos]|uniref:Uncharacterized protein n=1 Tax=Anas platyrhynchos TaxID=8839 RepID=R0JX34_ANAPL|nr:hypothetical protein Anapl_01563 [Anas platyrhynchos]